MSGAFTLVVLAAGMGSRYGGLKQLEPVGPGGATLMDYSVYDAHRAGCGAVVFIIRPDMEPTFQAFAAERYGAALAVRTAHQRLDDLPPGRDAGGRTRPWGTGHALLAAASVVDGPFVVINADDFYGFPAYRAAAAFAAGEAGGEPPRWAVIGYRLADTVSSAGGVNRAVCRTDAGWLISMEEVLDITAEGGAFAGRGAAGMMALEGGALVSMNMWVFTPALFPRLRDGLAAFLDAPRTDRSEFLLPDAVTGAVRRGAARVRVLDPGSRWFGMTYPADQAAVAAALAQLAREGQYPEPLRFA